MSANLILVQDKNLGNLVLGSEMVAYERPLDILMKHHISGGSHHVRIQSGIEKIENFYAWQLGYE